MAVARCRRPTRVSNSPVLILKPSGVGGKWSRARQLREASCGRPGAGVRAAYTMYAPSHHPQPAHADRSFAETLCVDNLFIAGH